MIDSSRRTVLTNAAAATAATTAPQVFAQAPQAEAPTGLPAGAKVGFYKKDNVRIRFAEIGSGFPLLATPGGGLNSRISIWPTAVINIMGEFKNDFRVITMDQRNATNGDSTGPVPVDNPWDAFADDQLGVMDHLGIRQFFLRQLHRRPVRDEVDGTRAGARGRRRPEPVGHLPEQPDYMYNSGKDVWAKEFRDRRPDVSMATIEAYLHSLYRVRPDFVYSVSRDFAKSCQTPMLVLPDDITAHPLQVSIDIASLAPNAEITVFPWKEPAELKARTINRALTFLKGHQTA